MFSLYDDTLFQKFVGLLAIIGVHSVTHIQGVNKIVKTLRNRGIKFVLATLK
jgi:hypothetical protein